MKPLHTVKEVHALLGFEGSKDMTQSALEALIRESRCHRTFGAHIRLTDADLGDFLVWTSARSGPAGEPADTDAGQIVAIGDPLERDGIVYINWTQRGWEIDELETVQVGCPEPVKILATWDATYGEFKALTARWADAKWKYRKAGNWWRQQVRADLKEKMDTDE